MSRPNSTPATVTRVRQRAWAADRGLQPDERDYLATVAANLRAPLSARAVAAFKNGSGGETADRQSRGGRPPRAAKMRALHSSSALAVNVFDYWSDAPDLGILGNALGYPGLRTFAFEAQHPTGLPGVPPNLDLELGLDDGTVVGVESKFTEWMPRRKQGAVAFKSKYYPSEGRVWQAVGLHSCQALAEALQDGLVSYLHLNAPQLLKHALGLATGSRRFGLLCLWYDVNGPEADIHREELADFAGRVGPELAFRSASYQDFFRAFALTLPAQHHLYLSYLAARYFPDSR